MWTTYSDQTTVVYKKGSSEHGHLSFEYIRPILNDLTLIFEVSVIFVL